SAVDHNRRLPSLPTRRSSDLPSPKASPCEPNLPWPMGKPLQPKDAEPKRGSSSETPVENSDLRQKREPKDLPGFPALEPQTVPRARQSTRLNSSHVKTSYAVF